MSWIGLVQIEKPETLPVSLSELKSYLRIVGNYDDALLTSMVKMCTSVIENYAERSIITQTWAVSYDFTGKHEAQKYNLKSLLNGYAFVYLPRGIVQEVTNFTIYDTNGNESVLPSTSYYVDNTNDKARLILKDMVSISSIQRDKLSFSIEYVAGFGDTVADVPADLQMAITVMVAQMYETRCEPLLNGMALAVAQSYKIYSLG